MFGDLRKRWTAEGCLYAPATTAEVEEWEKKQGIELTDELRNYFLEGNGTTADGDSELFAFYSLDRLVRWDTKEWPLDSGTPEDFEPRDWFVFADYMIASWAYAIHVGADPAYRGKVVGVGWGRYHLIASSFREFIDLYLSGSSSLHPGPPAPVEANDLLGKARKFSHMFKSLTGRSGR